MMPESSYAGDQWQGFEFYEKEIDDGIFLRGRIDFAVYDMENLNSEETEWVDGLNLDGEGKYLYAYQVFNDYDGWSEREISYFSVFSEGGEFFSLDESSIGHSEDPESGVEPGSGYVDDSSGTQVVWTWEPEPDGYGYIYAGNHSWFLYYLSDGAPTAGDYEIQAAEETGELPTPGVPEPATIALLGFGYVLVMFHKKKDSASHKT